MGWRSICWALRMLERRGYGWGDQAILGCHCTHDVGDTAPPSGDLLDGLNSIARLTPQYLGDDRKQAL